eukprot:15480910-Alexandrium_andersonii.AAC.1
MRCRLFGEPEHNALPPDPDPTRPTPTRAPTLATPPLCRLCPTSLPSLRPTLQRMCPVPLRIETPHLIAHTCLPSPSPALPSPPSPVSYTHLTLPTICSV